MRARFAFAMAGLVLLATLGELIIGRASATFAAGAGSPLPSPLGDFDPIWRVGGALMRGQPASPFYRTDHAWPPPHEVALAPLGLLPIDLASWVVRGLCAALLLYVVLLWARREGRLSPAAWPALVCVPVVALVSIDEFQTAIGLAALSLAIWAQRRNRWWLVGVAASVGLIRVANVLPVLAMLMIGGWGKPRQLLVALGCGAALMAPLIAVCYIWDANWVLHYMARLAHYPFTGPLGWVKTAMGLGGVLIVEGLTCAAAAWLVRRNAGRPLDLDRAALGLALTVAAAPLPGLYCAVFAVPALLRVGFRPGLAAVPWMMSAAPWLVILAAAPLLLGPEPVVALNLLTLLDLFLVAAAFPLLRLASGGETRGRIAGIPARAA